MLERARQHVAARCLQRTLQRAKEKIKRMRHESEQRHFQNGVFISKFAKAAAQRRAYIQHWWASCVIQCAWRGVMQRRWEADLEWGDCMVEKLDSDIMTLVDRIEKAILCATEGMTIREIESKEKLAMAERAKYDAEIQIEEMRAM